MRAVIVALAALPVLGGCVAVHAPEDWAKAATPLPQVTADELACERASRDAAWTPDLILGGVFDLVRVQIERTQIEHAYASCMRSRGYSKA